MYFKCSFLCQDFGAHRFVLLSLASIVSRVWLLLAGGFIKITGAAGKAFQWRWAACSCTVVVVWSYFLIVSRRWSEFASRLFVMTSRCSEEPISILAFARVWVS